MSRAIQDAGAWPRRFCRDCDWWRQARIHAEAPSPGRKSIRVFFSQRRHNEGNDQSGLVR